MAPYLRTLSGMARRLTHDAALAQDLVQDTLFRAYRFAHQFEPGTNFRAWLVTIMRNLYISQRRKQRRQVGPDGITVLPPRVAYAAPEEPDVTHLAELTMALPYLVTDDVFEACRPSQPTTAWPSSWRIYWIIPTRILPLSWAVRLARS